MSLDPRVLEGLRLLRARQWFDAHEELEAVWREEPAGEWREALQTLIQHAVALEHLKRGNALGTFKVWSRAKAKGAKLPAEVGGIALGAWAQALEAFYREVDLAQRVQGQLEGSVPAGDAPIELTPLPPEADWPLPRFSPDLEAQLGA
ncbi:MAG: DUF309 domain-containing protein [Planctomycetota bacterium]